MEKKYSSIISLGTNLGDRNENLRRAKEFIIHSNINIIQETDVLETQPIGFKTSNLFYNQIIKIKHDLSPIHLLKELKSIEQKMGRKEITKKATIKYNSRIIDLDILYFENINYTSINLEICHPQVYTRKFIQVLMKQIHKKNNKNLFRK